jgi:hypothetical protein
LGIAIGSFLLCFTALAVELVARGVVALLALFFSHCPFLLLGSCHWVWLALCVRLRLGWVGKPPPEAAQSLLIAFGAILVGADWPTYPQVPTA